MAYFLHDSISTSCILRVHQSQLHISLTKAKYLISPDSFPRIFHHTPDDPLFRGCQALPSVLLPGVYPISLGTCEKAAENGAFGGCFQHPFHRTQTRASGRFTVALGPVWSGTACVAVQTLCDVSFFHCVGILPLCWHLVLMETAFLNN